MGDQKTAVLWCHTEYPVVQNVREILQDKDTWTLREITTPIHMVNVPDVKAVLDGSDVVCLFISPNDLTASSNVTEICLTAIEEVNVPQLVWVAPVDSNASDVGSMLQEAEAKVREYEKAALIVRHGILYSELLRHRDEIRYRNTLSLPLGDDTLLWTAPEDVAEIVLKGVEGGLSSETSITLGMQATGHDIARTLSQQLAENLEGDRFAQRRFQAIDVDSDGNLTREELTPQMAELGYGPGEIDTILSNADVDGDGTINYEEFVHGMGGQMDQMLADTVTDIQYSFVPKAAFLYDMTTRGMTEVAAQQYLTLYQQSNAEYTEAVETWLSHPLTSLSTWLDEHILDFMSVYILPGKGVLGAYFS